MNSQKQQELQENLKFMTEQFSKLEQSQELPQRISAQAMKERLVHTKSQPRSSMSLSWGRWGKTLAAACAFVLVAMAAWRYAGISGNQVVGQTANDSTDDRMLAAERDIEASQRDGGAVYGMKQSSEPMPAQNNQIMPAMEEAQEESAVEETEGESSNYDSSNAASFFTYDEIRKELTSDSEQEEEKKDSFTIFGDDTENELSNVSANNVVSLAEHILYFGIDPETQRKTDTLSIYNAETNELEKQIVLPPKSKMDISMHIPDNEDHVILTAVGDTETHIGILSLKNFHTSDYVMSGCMEQCWMKGDTLYLASTMAVNEQMMQTNDFIPYITFDAQKELLPANRIYHLKDRKTPMQFTVLSAINLKTKAIENAAVLGGEMKAEMLQDRICVASTEDETVALSFSLRTLSPKEK